MGTINATWPEFKQMGKEFLDLLPDANAEQAENMFKAIGIAYLNMTGSSEEEHQSEILLRILSRKLIEHTATCPA